MSEYDKCPFCKIGQYKRMLMFRLIGNMTPGQIKTALTDKKLNKKIDYRGR